MSSLYGSICLSDIPRSQMKKVKTKDGKEKIYLNIFVGERKEPVTFGDTTFTHFVSCSPKKEERIEGENYFIGDLQTYNPQPSTPTAEQISEAPSVGADDNLPF
jgi:hypothetical protein